MALAQNLVVVYSLIYIKLIYFTITTQNEYCSLILKSGSNKSCKIKNDTWSLECLIMVNSPSSSLTVVSGGQRWEGRGL